VVARRTRDRKVVGSNLTWCHHVEDDLRLRSAENGCTNISRDKMYIACDEYMYIYVHCMCVQAC
jgi:hypothetical protein